MSKVVTTAVQPCPICKRNDGFHKQQCIKDTIRIMAETYSSLINRMYFSLKTIRDVRTIDRFAISEAMEFAEDKLRMLRVYTDGFTNDNTSGDPEATHKKSGA